MTVNSAGDALSKGVWWQVVTSSFFFFLVKRKFYKRTKQSYKKQGRSY